MAITDRRGADALIELDIAANAKLIPSVLRPKGTVVIYGVGGPEAQLPVYFCLINAITLKFIFVYELTNEERNAAIADIARMLEQDRLINNVALTFPLGEIVQAHEMVEQGKAVGNVLVRL